MCDLDEHMLFRRAQAGNRAAFDELQRALEPSVWRFVARLIGETGREYDIAQDAFLALWMNLERLDSPESLRPFLFRVVRNLCYDELRQQGRFHRVSLDELDEEEEEFAFRSYPLPFNPASLPEEATHWVLLYQRVQRAMDRLPEHQRQALILYAEEGFTYEQIAEAMNTDIGTVKSRIHYGRKNLLKLLTPEILGEVGIEKENEHG